MYFLKFSFVALLLSSQVFAQGFDSRSCLDAEYKTEISHQGKFFGLIKNDLKTILGCDEMNCFVTNENIRSENLSQLDNKIANQLRKLLINLWKQKKPTIIFVTHDLNEAIQLSDRIIFLSNLPAKILLDYKIKIKRPRSSNSAKFQSLKRLLSASVKP